jgi:hypothetical protein
MINDLASNRLIKKNYFEVGDEKITKLNENIKLIKSINFENIFRDKNNFQLNNSIQTFQARNIVYNNQNVDTREKEHKSIYSGNVSNELFLKSQELVMKKSIPYAIGRNMRISESEKSISPENSNISNYGISRDKEVQDIGLIAEEVYDLIEKKIEIEKDRRGLF